MCICLDGKIRGTIRYYQNYRTGFCGHVNLFDRNHKHTTDLNYLIDKINCNKHLTIYQSAIIIYLLKALVPFLLNFNNPKIVVDINRTTEYAIAKITGCDWRIDAYKNGNLEAVLRKKWPSVSLPHVDVRKLDMQFALGNYHTQLDELQVNEWKECNKEIIITRGNLIHAAHSALTSNKQIPHSYPVLDIDLDGHRTTITLHIRGKCRGVNDSNAILLGDGSILLAGTHQHNGCKY